MELITDFIINLIITAIIYLIVPAIFLFIALTTNRQYALATIKKIVIINGVCCWLFFRIAILEAGGDVTSGFAAFLWSGIAYKILKKYALIENREEEPISPHDGNCYEESINIFQNKGNKDQRYKAAISVVSLLLILSLGLNIYQGLQNSKPDYGADINQEKLAFYDECIVFVEDDGTNLYHKYECYRFKSDYYWAYNVEQAVYIGYEPCPICCR